MNLGVEQTLESKSETTNNATIDGDDEGVDGAAVQLFVINKTLHQGRVSERH